MILNFFAICVSHLFSLTLIYFALESALICIEKGRERGRERVREKEGEVKSRVVRSKKLSPKFVMSCLKIGLIKKIEICKIKAKCLMTIC